MSRNQEQAVTIPSEPRIITVLELILFAGVAVAMVLFGWEILNPHRLLPAPPPGLETLLDAEDLPVIAKNREFPLGVQSTSDFTTGKWNRDGQLFGFGDVKPGDWVEWSLPVAASGDYVVNLYLTRARDYGIVRATLNGAPAGADIDLWATDGVIRPTGPVTLGTYRLEAPMASLRLQVVGRNTKNDPPYYQFGIDGVRMAPAK